MNIKIHSNELNRMMKTIIQCVDAKEVTAMSNICVTHGDNLLTIRAGNGVYSAQMSAPVLGGDGESFCVDGAMFARVCAMCGGEIGIQTEGKTCTVKGIGRTRLPIVDAKVPEFERAYGKCLKVDGGDLAACYGSVAYAVATDGSRVQLTGVLTESDGASLRMVALDGFQMSVEEVECSGDELKATVPAQFLKMVSAAVGSGDEVTLTVDGGAVQAEADGMLLRCGMLAGEYPDWNRILPKDFQVKCKVSAEAVRNALKAGGVINNKQNLVKLDIGPESMVIRNNAEKADFEAEIPCATQGNGLKIAFNEKYLMNTLNAVGAEEAELNLNSATAPMVVKRMDGKGCRLVLPVSVR